jgi:hypothetical protein
MPESFELPVDHDGKEMNFPAELLTTGFSHRIKVTVEGTDIIFEPDEEKNYRATVADADRDKIGRLKRGLLQAISETLHELFS